MTTCSKTIIRIDSLSTDRISGVADEDLILCPICINVFWKPIACRTCENAFCLKCIRLWLKDNPNKCPFNCHFEERKTPSILLKILSKLKLNCRHQMNGCTLSIPYEALEKHELQECDYRLTQCSNCFKEIIKKDLDEHEKECVPQGEMCLKCGATYKRNEEHALKCLEKQMNAIVNKFRQTGKKPALIMENYDKMTDQYKRFHLNQNYAERTQSLNDIQDFTPSAPVYESSSPPPSEPGSSKTFSRWIDTNAAKPTRNTLRISTVMFHRISRVKYEGDHIPNGYAGFNWENAYYMFKDFATSNRQSKFLNAYTNSSNTVAYNSFGRPLSIFLPNPQQKFGLHSFSTMSIYHNDFKLHVTAYRSGVIFDTKKFILTNQKPTLFETNWEKIDRITFTPERIQNTYKPETFALTCLNFVF